MRPMAKRKAPFKVGDVVSCKYGNAKKTDRFRVTLIADVGKDGSGTGWTMWADGVKCDHCGHKPSKKSDLDSAWFKREVLP